MMQTNEFAVEMPVQTRAEQACRVLCRRLAAALAISLLFSAGSYLKYRQAARKLAVYQKGALSLIGAKVTDMDEPEEDPASYSYALGGPVHPPARAIGRSALPIASGRRLR